MSGEEEERRRRAVERERKEQRTRSELGRKSNDIGRFFHNGIAQMRGETHQNGWQSQRSIKLPSGRERIHDGARSLNDNEFREYKHAKTVGGEFVMEQISKDRENLQTDPKAKGAWVVIEGSPDPAARRELEKLEREFEGRFQLIEITPEQARKAAEIGQDLERNPNQLELLDSGKLRARERAKEMREKRQEKDRVQAAAREAIEKRERERRILEEQRRQREAVNRVAERVCQEREAVARGERPAMTGHEAADILRINRPPPGSQSPFRESPQVTRRGEAPGRNRSRGVERDGR
ncbi:hypothetical protein [Nocardia sienata]|uniref:hypothetical protein n=1 Tax=Nocardia sienata TaxID=248552 RepID=UPI000AE9C8B5|nr:hypothetical protein [Nocardia sienata]